MNWLTDEYLRVVSCKVFPRVFPLQEELCNILQLLWHLREPEEMNPHTISPLVPTCDVYALMLLLHRGHLE